MDTGCTFQTDAHEQAVTWPPGGAVRLIYFSFFLYFFPRP